MLITQKERYTLHQMGIRLSLARTIVKEFDGRIKIEASNNYGTTVAIHLPILLETGETKEDQLVQASITC